MEQLPFDPADPKSALAALPHAPAVFALYGADAHAEPYIGRTPNLRARLERLLQPSPKHPRRLQLAGRVRRIEYCLSGSDFESLLAQFSLLEEVYGTKSLDRMHLRMPAFVRYLGGNPYPRITVTNRPSLHESGWSYGPFPSRMAAERYAEEALKLFLLRRCTFELDPDPSYPGCVYSEMKMCLAPCFKGCTDARYQEESVAVESFFSTRGESRLVPLRAQREEASANLEFESAASIHAQVQRVESVRALASELVRPLSQLRTIILQASSQPGEVSVFLFADGRLRGPAAFSTLGMRIQNEQSGSTSLFAQPMTVEPIPEEQRTEEQGIGNREQGIEISPSQSEGVLKGHDFSRADNSPSNDRALAPEGNPAPQKLPRSLLESRMEAALASLAERESAPSSTIRQGHLALLKRWYYRPEARRAGEIFFPDAEGQWPVKALLRGAGRVAAKMLAPAGPH
jgi:excinuclease ABC subunit C